MINRDELRNELYKSYDQESSVGLFGFFLSGGHKSLEYSVLSDSRKPQFKILEIGGARNPHYQWIDEYQSIQEYHIEDLDECSDDYPLKVSRHLPGKLYQNPTSSEYFNRIIACHLWEHVTDPLNALE